jgi:hypothetical protein
VEVTDRLRDGAETNLSSSVGETNLHSDVGIRHFFVSVVKYLSLDVLAVKDMHFDGEETSPAVLLKHFSNSPFQPLLGHQRLF